MDNKKKPVCRSVNFKVVAALAFYKDTFKQGTDWTIICRKYHLENTNSLPQFVV